MDKVYTMLRLHIKPSSLASPSTWIWNDSANWQYGRKPCFIQTKIRCKTLYKGIATIHAFGRNFTGLGVPSSRKAERLQNAIRIEGKFLQSVKWRKKWRVCWRCNPKYGQVMPVGILYVTLYMILSDCSIARKAEMKSAVLAQKSSERTEYSQKLIQTNPNHYKTGEKNVNNVLLKRCDYQLN